MRGCLKSTGCRLPQWWPRTRDLAAVGLLAGLLVTGGCAPRAMRGEAVDLRQEMRRQAVPEVPGLRPAPPALGPEVPYVPVVTPPRVQRVWIPAHIDESGDLVAGHWIYLMLERSRWFGEDGGGARRLSFDVPANIGVRPRQSVVVTPADLDGLDGAGSVEGD